MLKTKPIIFTNILTAKKEFQPKRVHVIDLYDINFISWDFVQLQSAKQKLVKLPAADLSQTSNLKGLILLEKFSNLH